jgi:F-type H+-transporting ATPase subunit delta
MVSHQRIVNYAKALFDVSGPIEEFNQRQQHLMLIANLITEYPEMLVLLGCPEVGTEKKLAVLQRILQEPLNAYVKSLLTLLIKRRLVSSIRLISKEYHKLMIYNMKEIEAEVATAEPLTAKERGILLRNLEEKFHKKAHIIETVDPSLLIGMTVLVHDQMIDLSAKGIFTNLKKQMLKAKL